MKRLEPIARNLICFVCVRPMVLLRAINNRLEAVECL
jgi:hypothetical protein